MLKQLLAILLLISVAYAGNLTIDANTTLNGTVATPASDNSSMLMCLYVSQDGTVGAYQCGTTPKNGLGDNMVMFTSTLALVILAAGFAYLHTKSQNVMWSSIWLSLMFVMVLTAIMGMQIQANDAGDAQTAGIMTALFAIVFWILMVIMAIFGFNLIKSFLQLIKEAVDGKKK